jgi:hypothetical protein
MVNAATTVEAGVGMVEEMEKSMVALTGQLERLR